MNAVELKPFKNGRYRINNVPYAYAEGEPFLQGDILKKVAKTISFMEQYKVYETDFESDLFKSTTENTPYTEKELKRLATFEMNRYRALLELADEKNEDVQERNDALKQLKLLNSIFDELENRLQELIRIRFMKVSDTKKVYDDLATMENLNLSRPRYYALKSDALLEIGRKLVEGAD